MLAFQPKNVLIIKPSSLGDIIHALPTLSALRAVFPYSRISWLVKSEWAELLEGHPDLSEVIPVDFRLRSWWKIIAMVREQAFDCVVDLQGLFRSGLLAKLSGSSVRVGFAQGREGSPWFYTHRVRLPNDGKQPWRLLDIHAVDRNLEIAKFFGASTEHPRFWLPRWQEDRAVIHQLFAGGEVEPQDRLIAIAPASKHTMKNWPLERFLEVAVSLAKQKDIKIVLIGSPAESQISQRFSKVLGPALINLIGKTRIRQLSLVFDKVQLCIANDSGPIHMAAACRVPVIACFGPTNPQATGPYGIGHVRMVSHTTACRPCGLRKCQNSYHLECLESISAEEVIGQAERMLAMTSPFPGRERLG